MIKSHPFATHCELLSKQGPEIQGIFSEYAVKPIQHEHSSSRMTELIISTRPIMSKDEAKQRIDDVLVKISDCGENYSAVYQEMSKVLTADGIGKLLGKLLASYLNNNLSKAFVEDDNFHYLFKGMPIFKIKVKEEVIRPNTDGKYDIILEHTGTGTQTLVRFETRPSKALYLLFLLMPRKEIKNIIKFRGMLQNLMNDAFVIIEKDDKRHKLDDKFKDDKTFTESLKQIMSSTRRSIEKAIGDKDDQAWYTIDYDRSDLYYSISLPEEMIDLSQSPSLEGFKNECKQMFNKNKKIMELGLVNKVKKKYSKKTIDDVNEEISALEWSDKKDFFIDIDDVIKSRKRNPYVVVKGIEKLYKKDICEVNTNPRCFEYTSEPVDQYSLTNEEEQLLKDINSFQSKTLETPIFELYTTTKIVLCDAPQAEEDISDLLGRYTHKEASSGINYTPIVRLYMDNIDNEAKRLGCSRTLIIACVYIHEMLHRYYDVRPDLNWKEYIKEIEEPMTEYATIKYIEEFIEHAPKYAILLPIQIVMTEGLRNSKMHFIYALGLDLYYNKSVPTTLINEYRHVSLMMHSDAKHIKYYLDNCEQNRNQLANLVTPLIDIIKVYNNLFKK